MTSHNRYELLRYELGANIVGVDNEDKNRFPSLKLTHYLPTVNHGFDNPQ